MLREEKSLKGLLQGAGVFCPKSTERYCDFVPEIRFLNPDVVVKEVRI